MKRKFADGKREAQPDCLYFRAERILVSIKAEEYDERFSHDGGSYYQPTITARTRGYTLVIEDTSCGDFGTRIYVSLWRGGAPKTWKDGRKPIAVACYGSMLDAESEYSDFKPGRFASLAKALGYIVPTEIRQKIEEETKIYAESITVDGITYKMIDESKIQQELLPGHKEATAYGSWLCVRADEKPDEYGCVKIYKFKYVLMDAEDYESDGEWYDNVDWEAPDDVVETPYMWFDAMQIIC